MSNNTIKPLLTGIICLFGLVAFSQTGGKDTTGIFEKIVAAVKGFQPDITAPPNDKMTQKIMELRRLRGGFNIEEAMQYKLEEERQQKDANIAAINQFATFLQSGNGKHWLENAAIWIYRQHFTYKELKKLVKFYKTSAGKKMASDFPIILIKTLQSAEYIKGVYEQQQKAKG